MAGRAAVVSMLLGSGTFIKITSPQSLPIDTDAFFALVGVTYVLTAAYIMLLRYTEQHRWLIDLQLVGCAVGHPTLGQHLTSILPDRYLPVGRPWGVQRDPLLGAGGR